MIDAPRLAVQALYLGSSVNASYHLIVLLESVKGSGNVSKCNPTGEFSLESIKMSFSPVYQFSPLVQSSDCRLPEKVDKCPLNWGRLRTIRTVKAVR